MTTSSTPARPDLPAELEIEPVGQHLDTTVTVPGSKSYTNRALVAAALADGRSTLRGALFSDDTLYLAEALRQAGFTVEASPEETTFHVTGAGGRVPATRAAVYVGNAGTAARFLPPLLALGHGTYTLDGNPRMRERPIGPLLAALRTLGARVAGADGSDHVPLRLDSSGLRGGHVSIPGHLSSQYLSGILLSAPYMAEGVEVAVEGSLVSRPYLDMTLDVMRAFGVTAENAAYQRFSVSPGQRYRPCDYRVEPDASAASYFFAAAAICGGSVTVEGLGSGSLQGDLAFVDVLERMGCQVSRSDDRTTVAGPAQLHGVEVDLADLSDTAQTLAVVAPFADSPTRITGIGFIRRKETDRVGAVVAELRRLGIDATEERDGMTIRPGLPAPGRVDTYDDHRMAMSFALLGLRCPGIVVRDPACVSKTFPAYFDVLVSLSTRPTMNS